MNKKSIIISFFLFFCGLNMSAQTDKVVRKRSESQTNLIPQSSVSQQTKPSARYSNGVLTVNGVRYTFAKVQGGTFTMGITASEMQNSYDTAYQVTLSSYNMGKTEVTQALWKAVMGNNPSEFKGDNLPIEEINWHDCQEFISKLNSLTSQNFRLPTEAEWEFAARGGNNSNHYHYSGSNNIGEVAWYEKNSGGTTHDVATKKPNELGIYDMSGNVTEWCFDRFGNYNRTAQRNPTGPNSGQTRVQRGGGCSDYAERCLSLSRWGCGAGQVALRCGFRLAISE